MGRPPKYSIELQNQICEHLKQGATRTSAAEGCGISRDTFRDWLQRYPAFSGAVTRAEAEAELIHTRVLMRASSEDWRASESWLKRRRRDEWGDNTTVRADQEAEAIIAALLHRHAAEDSGADPEPSGS